MPDKFRQMTSCKSCPCRTLDYDEDSCNLGYDVGYYWTMLKTLVTASINCKLKCVKYAKD